MDNTPILLEISHLQDALNIIHGQFITLANSDGIGKEDRDIYIEMLIWVNTSESILRNTATAIQLKPESCVMGDLEFTVEIIREQIAETQLKLKH